MKQYLGDGVYVDADGFHIILTTEDGREHTNRIYLEDSVFKALIEYGFEIFPYLKPTSPKEL